MVWWVGRVWWVSWFIKFKNIIVVIKQLKCPFVILTVNGKCHRFTAIGQRQIQVKTAVIMDCRCLADSANAVGYINTGRKAYAGDFRSVERRPVHRPYNAHAFI
jgi:hypothetical protein